MSQKANPTYIGLFIIVGVALGVIGLVLFSSSRLFSSTFDCIVYFNSSLNGLNVGAPVKFRGVTVGSVKRVMIRYNQATNDYAMPVIIEFQEDLLRERIDDPAEFRKEILKDRVERGLRASLQTESLVTGVLYVGLEVDPHAPAVYHQLEKIYFEIPSKPTEIQELMKNLASLDIAGLEKKLSGLVTRLDTAIGELNLGAISAGVTNLVGSVNRVVTSPNLTNAVAELRAALEQYRLLAENVNRQVDPVASGLTNSLAKLNTTLEQLGGASQDLRGILSPDSALQHDLTLMLEQLASAAQSIAALIEFLERNPNALITGRKLLPTP